MVKQINENPYLEMFQKRPEYFKVFKEHIDKVRVVEGGIVTLLKRLKPFILTLRKEKVMALDIGTGSGTTLIPLAKKFCEETGNEIIFDCIEPSKEMVGQLNSNIKKYKTRHYLREIFNEKWEDYDTKNRYDIILSHHSWNGIRGWQNTPKEDNTLFKIFNYLNTPGLADIVISSQESSFYKLHKLLSSDQRILGFCAEEIQRELSKLGTAFTTDRDYYKLDISDCLSEQIEEKEKMFLSYISRQELLGVPKEKLKRIQESVKEVAIREKGRYFYEMDNIHTWIEKT